jgi:hypothetical protein
MKKYIIILLSITLIVSCKRLTNNEISNKSNPYDANHPPPPPTQAEIEEAMKNLPSPEETIKAIRNEYKQKGYTEKQISDIISQFKAEYKSECPKCYEKIKNIN